MPKQATVVMAPAATGSRWRVERWFYISVALFMILLSVVGFGPSIIDPSGRLGPLTPLVTAHGIVVGAWLLLFLTQATLVATRRTAVHRRLGILGAVLMVLIIVLGYVMTIEAGRRGFELSGDVGRNLGSVGMLFPLAFFLTFGVLVAAALCYRHRPDVHKRLMLLALLNPLASVASFHLITHWVSQGPVAGGINILIGTLFLCVSGIYDRVSQGRIHPVSLWVPILLFAWQVVLGSVVQSATWREVAAWLVR